MLVAGYDFVVLSFLNAGFTGKEMLKQNTQKLILHKALFYS